MTDLHASPEQMPHLEPLTGPNSEDDCIVHDRPVTPCPPAPLQPRQVDSKRDVGVFMRDILTAPSKLTLVLENKGNVARDHLASERTYLAYVRTSLACAGAGVAVVQLLLLSTTAKGGIDLRRFAKPLGATTILVGMLVLVFGLVRYFSTQSALVRGQFPVARHSITAIAFILGTLICTVFAVIVAETRS